jgi:hypothetical protein
LYGCPDEVANDFSIMNNYSILLSLIGGPKKVGGNYIIDSCGLTSLEGIPNKIGNSLSLSSNPLTSLRGINKLKEMNGYIYVDTCPITSHILGVFFISGCHGLVSDHIDSCFKAASIVNSHISKGRAGLIPCQMELIEAGLADFAQI